MNDKLNSLSPQKRMFVLEYLKTWKPRVAAEAVNLATMSGSRLLAEPDIQEAVAEQMERRIMETQIDADWVLIELSKMFQADLADLFVPGTNDLRPVHEWPEAWRKMATDVKVDNRWTGTGEDRVDYIVKDIKIMDRLKTLELIGKHTNVKAFMERHEVTTDQDLTDRLLAGRKRARERNTETDEPLSFL
jgi:phage terminase small subunit